MVKLTATAIIAQLEGHGLKRRSVTAQTEGDYLPADADWNNKDIQHLNHVHAWANDVTAIIEEDLQASISLQKVLGITAPTVIVHYDAEPAHQSHFFTLLAWTFVTDIEFIPVTPTRTRVISTYTVMARPFWMLAFPVIRVLLRRNNRQLMSEDVPLRERRGLLRRWGYTFRGDDRPTRDVRDSINIHRDNVIPPDGDVGATSFAPVPVRSVREDEWTLVGRSDHDGLRLRRYGNTIACFARMCPHEGADLDDAACDGAHQRCPWHGRKLAPVATIDLDGDETEYVTPGHRITVDEDSVHVDVRPGVQGTVNSLSAP